ncbi:MULTISPECIES: GntR family transcriptional regulator [Rhodopseudomonas]|uniref:HTH gntR-type domain-containing protein n=1 Tax=Rhodopseudomonas palustris TaxID=1076 RepID=A0A0D7EZ81_RHOPL|nr:MULTISPECIES: GntR family transcriptional regulator [Rhodopseudomonas]KIZ46158.1 hypothetical protein OO17_07060 [Rhodopseudomonas palustris]MDF3809723.1 GntR family transcriptional regulator [Rhodopseudomonas sp. BAL398]WOK17551.1 GntR family transcriptional regulator [Rhodopseudomonas sp. BAL398]
MTKVNKAVTTRGQAVLRSLRELVLAGRLPPGSRLNEIELADCFGVSRTPVRAALTALASEDLINYTPNSGYTTRVYTTRDLENVFEVRAVLEGLANRQAAEFGLSPDMQRDLEANLRDTKDLVDSGVWSRQICDQWVDLNGDFHKAIARASGNQRLVAALEKSPVPFILEVRHYWFTLEIVTKAYDDHVEMFEVIRRRQVGRAEAIGREHIYRTTKPLIDKWRERENVRSTDLPGSRISIPQALRELNPLEADAMVRRN